MTDKYNDTKSMMLKALHCLRLEAPATVMDDVSRIFNEYVAEVENPTKSEPFVVEIVENENGGTLTVRRNGRTVLEERDGEDDVQSFYRDWKWVAPAIEAAYAYGVEDGKATK